MSRSTIANTALTTQNTEYHYTIPANVKRIRFKLRALNALLKFCFTESGSGSDYITVFYGETYEINDAKLGGKTLFVQSPSNTQVLEVETWL